MDLRADLALVFVSFVPFALLVLAIAFEPFRHAFLASLVLDVAVVVALLAADVWAMLAAFSAHTRMRQGVAPAVRGVDYGIGNDEWWVTVPPVEPYRGTPRRELAARGSPLAAARDILKRLLTRAAWVSCVAALLAPVVLGPLHRSKRVGDDVVYSAGSDRKMGTADDTGSPSPYGESRSTPPGPAKSSKSSGSAPR